MRELPREPRESTSSEGIDPATCSLATASPLEIAKMFLEADGQVVRTLLLPSFLEAAVLLVDTLRERAPDTIVVGGAGTSGRIAYLAARNHLAPLGKKGIKLIPWIAGGPVGLKQSVENAEDDVTAIRKALPSQITSRSLFLGVSCGLSAPCVASGIAMADSIGARTAIFANNPLPLKVDSLASSAQTIDLSNPLRLMSSVLSSLANSSHFFPLIAEVGPEVLQGSSRLKGGTSTWIFLEALFSAITTEKPAEKCLRDSIESHPLIFASDTILEAIATGIKLAAEAINSGGNVYYVGDEKLGPVGVLDASEWPPTFGVPRSLGQGYVNGGWSAFAKGSLSDKELSQLSANHPIDLTTFTKLSGSLRPDDLVVILGDVSLPKTSAKTFTVPTSTAISTKVFLNAVSTGAFAQTGKVWQNVMIDLIASNSKLVARAVGIVALAGKCSDDTAKVYYTRSLALLHEKAESELATLDDFSLAKLGRSGAIPLAVLLARSTSSAKALEIIKSGHNLRDILKD